MKKLLLLAAFLIQLFGQQAIIAQQRDQATREKIKEWRTAFITDKLDLSTTEAEKFWPIYNQRDQELRSLRKKIKSMDRQKSFDEMSDVELEKLIRQRFEYKQQELNLKIKYFERFKKAIPIHKIVKLRIAEERFKRLLMEKMKGHQSGASKGRSYR